MCSNELFGGNISCEVISFASVSSRSRAGTAPCVHCITFPDARHLFYYVWAAVPWGPCPNTMKALLHPQSRSQEKGGFWLEHNTPRVGVIILQALLHVPAVTPAVVCYKDISCHVQHFPLHPLWPNWGLHYCLPDPVLCLILPAQCFVPTGQAKASVTPALRFIQVSLTVQILGLKH